MPDVTVKSIDDMEAIYGGLARRARAELGVTAWGMQVFTLPPDWDGYPNHKHSSDAFDPNQEEVYIPLSGAATLVADGSEFALRPGTMAGVGPDQLRRILPGPDGIRLVAWLHAIATNVCLTAIARRRARPAESIEDLEHLQPYPDRLLEDLVVRETVELAFITAIQLLPPKQRAVLILRDVLGWSAKEAAEALDDSVAAVTSALQRARIGLEGARRHNSVPSARERALVKRFMTAWDAVDIDGLVALLREDALMTMPPERMRVAGARAIGDFFGSVPQGGRLDEIRLLPTWANRQPAL